jgi:hypothetical protein
MCATGYIPDEGNFSDFCQSLLSGFALLACGNPGSGKTVFSDALLKRAISIITPSRDATNSKQEELLCSWDSREQDSFMREARPLARSVAGNRPRPRA